MKYLLWLLILCPVFAFAQVAGIKDSTVKVQIIVPARSGTPIIVNGTLTVDSIYSAKYGGSVGSSSIDTPFVRSTISDSLDYVRTLLDNYTTTTALGSARGTDTTKLILYLADSMGVIRGVIAALPAPVLSGIRDTNLLLLQRSWLTSFSDYQTGNFIFRDHDTLKAGKFPSYMTLNTTTKELSLLTSGMLRTTLTGVRAWGDDNPTGTKLYGFGDGMWKLNTIAGWGITTGTAAALDSTRLGFLTKNNVWTGTNQFTEATGFGAPGDSKGELQIANADSSGWLHIFWLGNDRTDDSLYVPRLGVSDTDGKDTMQTRNHARATYATLTERGADTTRAIVRENAKMNAADFDDSVNAYRAQDTARAIVREGLKMPKSDSLHYQYEGYNWTLDSTALALYGTRFNRQWFRTGRDSVKIDSLGGIMSGASGDTVTFRYLWGVDRTTPQDSCSDLQVTSLTYGNVVAGSKVIPPERFVWLKVTKKTGNPVSAAIWIDGRKKW